MRILLLTVFALTVGLTNAQSTEKMKLNAGIITEKLQETKKFYTEFLDFGVSFENEFYLLLHTPNQSAELSFCYRTTQAKNQFSNRHLMEKECI